MVQVLGRTRIVEEVVEIPTQDQMSRVAGNGETTSGHCHGENRNRESRGSLRSKVLGKVTLHLRWP